MDDVDLTQQLAAFHREGSTEPLPPGLRDAVMRIPTERTQPHARLRPTLAWRGSAMLSPAKLAAAAVVVVLFAGFLLAGALTTPRGDETAPAAATESPEPRATNESPAPSIRTDILPGVDLTVEEVERGIFRIVDDGVRDVAIPAGTYSERGLSVDQDGGIWVAADRMAYRLGQATEPGWAEGRSGLTVTSDGTLWGRLDSTPFDSTLSSFDGQSWTERATLDPAASVTGIASTPDGTTWATITDSSQCPDDFIGPSCAQTLLVRFDAMGASTSPGWEEADPGRLSWHKPVVSPDGDLWLVDDGNAEMQETSVAAFHHYDGTDWHTVDVPEGLTIAGKGESFGFGPEGTLWAATTAGRAVAGGPFELNHGLARLDDSGWTAFTETDGVQAWGGQDPWTASDHLQVAADGTVWVNGADDRTDCGGVASFDGASWTPYLQDYCIRGLGTTPDGNVWILASASPGRQLGIYVITPEAVAANKAEVTETSSIDAATDAEDSAPGASIKGGSR